MSRFSNGDVYDGCWKQGKRCGYGTLEAASRKNSKYTGGWRDDKRSGYGVYDDRMRWVWLILALPLVTSSTGTSGIWGCGWRERGLDQVSS